MSINVRPGKTYINEDQRWIAPGGISALRDMDSITLDRSAFDLVTNFPNNVIPSGVALGKITATGLYGPYGGNASEVQRIAVDATGGTFTITFDGATTAAISATAAASAVQTALEALSNVSPGDVVVTGGPGAAGGATPYVLTFGGRYIGQNVPAVTTAAGSLTGGAGTAAVTTFTAGGSAVSDGRETFVGYLGVSVPIDSNGASTDDEPAALYWHGEIVESYLPTNHGTDAAAKAAGAAKFRWI